VKLLLLTPQPPFPPNQGTAIRNWAILRHVATRHDVTLLTFAAGAEVAAPPELVAICQAVHIVPRPIRSTLARLETLALGEADLAWRLWSAPFDEVLRRVLADNQFDIVQIEGLELGRYLQTVRRMAPASRIVYDAHNAEITLQKRALDSDRQSLSRLPAALYSRLQLGPLARFEADICRAADAVIAVSPADGETLDRQVNGLKVVVVPNGIDLGDFRPTPAAASSGEPQMVFTGKMDFRPNVDAALWFADEILPLVLAQRADSVFKIVGQSPAPQISRLGQRPGIIVTGAVPDTRPHIAQAAVYVAPLRMGGGTRFKLLEAMALSRPIVSTSLGAEGFDVEAGRELLVAETPATFAAAVLRLFDDDRQATKLGANGRAFVERSYSWNAILPRLDAVHDSLAARQSRMPPSGAAG
jgi:sugar transferase (PEP-CTERM/EpsH1 system associated)